ncbi:MAG: transposase [Candidatus Paceibacterota bacterium]|jgi:REP element-mobilizing transposase RayT
MKEIYYHIYNRGAHKAVIFNDASDYWRMLKLLYIANNTESFELKGFGEKDIFSIERKGTLVDIVAYCLMPNHFHIVLKLPEASPPENITKFMHKFCTGYSGYYNKKYDHSGTIWQGSFKEKGVYEKDYLDKLINYVHLNPYGIKEPEMSKEAQKEHAMEAMAYSKNYEYSSFKDYLGEIRKQTPILFSGGYTSGRNFPTPPTS